MAFYITKASGEKELFDAKKFKHSLAKAGASPDLTNQIIADLEKMPQMRTTQEIYDFALRALGKKDTPIASRYTIKRALFELGPAGMPFEQFIAMLFKEQGYTVTTNSIISGHCVDHEVDVIAIKDTQRCMIECKFHNQQGPKTDVRVTLYVKARFDDIEHANKNIQSTAPALSQLWVATNTKFTSEAIKYAQCTNLHLLGWSYPETNNLQSLIESLHAHPITTLISLNRQQKRTLINHNIILCRDVPSKARYLQNLLHLRAYQINSLVEECTRICAPD